MGIVPGKSNRGALGTSGYPKIHAQWMRMPPNMVISQVLTHPQFKPATSLDLCSPNQKVVVLKLPSRPTQPLDPNRTVKCQEILYTSQIPTIKPNGSWIITGSSYHTQMHCSYVYVYIRILCVPNTSTYLVRFVFLGHMMSHVSPHASSSEYPQLEAFFLKS